MPNNRKDSTELCAGGQILEATVIGDLNSIKTMLAEQKESFVGIFQQIQELKEYSIRDNEKIVILEESKKCKSKKLKVLEDESQEMAVDFATHLGEHKAERRLTVASGTISAGGILGMWELFKFLIKGS